MKPENEVWASYKSTLGKLINFNGTIIGKLLTGEVNNINIFFTEENGYYSMNAESHKLTIKQLNEQSKNITKALQQEYVKCSLEKLQNSIMRSGETASIFCETNNTTDIYTLTIGSTGRRFIVSVDNKGAISEEVHGVIGKSCVDLTSVFESCVADVINREWTVEYSETVEDQVVQVLNLV
ncbi:MAG: DUF2997 domain-containing protein [Deltaproteobacteria bacterium]